MQTVTLNELNILITAIRAKCPGAAPFDFDLNWDAKSIEAVDDLVNGGAVLAYRSDTGELIDEFPTIKKLLQAWLAEL